jgi:RNA polymerase sigma-70 factor (family 1)
MHSLSKDIILAVKQGDRKAFEIFYNTYSSFVYQVAYKILRDTHLAEEVVQECFVNLWVNKENIDENKEITSFIFVIAKRICLNNLRKLKYTNTYLTQVSVRHINDVQEKIEYSEFEKSMISKVSSLPKQQRIAFELSRFEGYTHQQIADKMGVSPNTVKNHISQALAYLRKCLSATKYEIPFLIIFFLFN